MIFLWFWLIWGNFPWFRPIFWIRLAEMKRIGIRNTASWYKKRNCFNWGDWSRLSTVNTIMGTESASWRLSNCCLTLAMEYEVTNAANHVERTHSHFITLLPLKSVDIVCILRNSNLIRQPKGIGKKNELKRRETKQMLRKQKFQKDLSIFDRFL